MNRNYRNGRSREYRSINLLRGEGFECVRSAGSKGHWDVVAWNAALIRFVQVKKNPPSKAELQSLTKAGAHSPQRPERNLDLQEEQGVGEKNNPVTAKAIVATG